MTAKPFAPFGPLGPSAPGAAVSPNTATNVMFERAWVATSISPSAITQSGRFSSPNQGLAHWGGERMRKCHRGPAPFGCLAGEVTAILPVGAGLRRLDACGDFGGWQ